jgi:hypothetical protein
MRLRVTRSAKDDQTDQRQIERVFRLGLGSWSGRLRRADVLVEKRKDSGGGLEFACCIHASLISRADISVYGLGADFASAVQSATRHLVRQIRRHVQSAGCFPLGG